MTLRNFPRHPWRFENLDHAGQVVRQTHWSRVVNSRWPADLEMTEAHVRQAMARRGHGNSQLCAGTFCVMAHRDNFHHDVVGYTDWCDSRVFVASHINRDGYPDKCYRYRHYDNIAKEFDSPAGCQRLIARIRANGGTLLVRLLPDRRRRREATDGRPHGRSTGERSNRMSGAKLRAARVRRGGG